MFALEIYVALAVGAAIGFVIAELLRTGREADS